MQTLKGFEAIKVAEEYQVQLFDTEYRSEVSVEEAKQFIASQRRPQSFVLSNWPDSEEEAESLVLQVMETHLQETCNAQIRLDEMLVKMDQMGQSMHPYAVELAAERLVAQRKLILASTQKDVPVLELPRTIYFRDSFLEKIDDLICPDCARLDLDGPFHAACVVKLVDFLASGTFTLNDITEEREPSTGASLLGKWTSRPGLDIQWLSKRAQAAKTRWQSVIKPFFTREDEDEYTLPNTSAKNVFVSPPPSTPVVHEETTVEKIEERPLSSVDKRISKQQLIEYLQSVEIIDEGGEIVRLRRERGELENRLELREQEIRRLQKEQALLEKQCEELQADVNKFVEAMQIVSKRSSRSLVQEASATQTLDKDHES
ncbi:hypothetical protein ACOJUR_13050 [Alicyclobacillus tolerans]|uniref:hypothetical protein n=1 Tax=Alicyclobacillus tolerans TaxID=90970 RepID=UPI003B7C4A23